MSTAQFQIISRCLDVPNCSKVTLCMKTEWADKTLSGLPFLQGTIVAQGTVKLPATVNGCYQEVIPSGLCPPCGNVYPAIPATPLYTLDACSYVVNVFLDDQVQDDPNTELPWVPVATDVCEIIPYWCLTESLVTAFSGTFGIQVDATLKRDGNLISINDLPEPDAGFVTLVGIDGDGNAVRVSKVLATAVMSVASESLGNFAPDVLRVVDYDLVESDDHSTIATGLGWIMTVPKTGSYRATARLKYADSPWGHHGSGEYAAIFLYTKKNSDASEPLATQFVSGYETSPHSLSPEVEGTRVFQLNAGDTLQFLTKHSDTSLGSVHGMSIVNSRVSIERIN